MLYDATPDPIPAKPSSKYGICLTSIIRNETRLKRQLSKFQKIPVECLENIAKSCKPQRKLTEQIELLNLFLYVHGIGFLIPIYFRKHPHLHKLTMGKIFQLCYVASVYGFAAGNPKHPLRENVIRTLQKDNDAALDFKQLAAFMIVNYNNDVLDDMAATQHCTKNGALMQGVTNWLLLELIGDHQPREVISLTKRISKLLIVLTFDDLIEKQLKLLTTMKESGLSVKEIKEYFIVKQANELSCYDSF